MGFLLLRRNPPIPLCLIRELLRAGGLNYPPFSKVCLLLVDFTEVLNNKRVSTTL